MEIKQLTSFLTIAETKNFTRAAQQLNYAQSTITAQIQALEHELQVKLFERLGHQVNLTPEGKQLIPYAAQIIKLTKEARNALSPSELPKGTLTIGTIESLCSTRLPKILNIYHTRYPQVEILIKLLSGGYDAFHLLKENTVDIALLINQKIQRKDFVTAIQFPEPLILLSPPNHPLASQEAVYPNDLDNQPFIFTEEECLYRVQFSGILAPYKVKPRAVLETDNVQTIKRLSASGLGLCLLPEVITDEEITNGTLAKLNWKGPDFELYTQLVYHRTKWISAPLKAFLDLAHEVGL